MPARKLERVNRCRKHHYPLRYGGLTLNSLYLALLFASFVIIEVLIGGTRLVFSLPSYGIISLVAVSTLFSFRRPQFPAGIFCLAGTAIFLGYILVRSLVSPVEYLARPDVFSALG